VKLSTRHEHWIHAILVFVYFTGVGWMVLRYGVTGGDGLENAWRVAAAWTLRAHGAGAMFTLVAFGSVLALHVPSAWKLRRNLVSGHCMLATVGVLAVTGWLLYYASDETIRARSSYVHMGVGIAGPLVLVWHLVYRRRVSRASKRTGKREPEVGGRGAPKNILPLRR
jgi:hypothetical protein